MTIEKKSKLMLFPRAGKIVILVFTIALVFVGIRAYQLYQFIFRENIKTEYILYIHKNWTFEQVKDSLTVHDVFFSPKAFSWVSKKKNYKKSIKPGRYELKEGMNTNQVVNMLRAGLQTPLNVTFNNVRFKEQLASKVSNYILADSAEIVALFSNEKLIEESGFNSETFKAMFIPETYQFYWTTTSLEFAKRMKEEYEKFWNKDRLEKAKILELSPVEVSILASIVQEETAKKDELKRVAGLYVNRLKKGMYLQADPTVKYAVGDATIQRVLTRHLEIDSPYNTYKNLGLPPGPINFPETISIDAVLNYEEHKYIFMCAKEDFSGYHNFAVTLSQHNRNAAKYRAALDKNKIR